MKFLDQVKIYIKAGNGGSGSPSFRREKFIEFGGPDGGDGGRGGHVIIRANPQLWTLFTFKFKKHFKAGNGGDGSGSRKSGPKGKDVIVEVPYGTIIKDSISEKVIEEINKDNTELIVLQGGLGGRGNYHFKSSTNQTPRYSQKGISGKEMNLTLELKVLADVGLVGFPNAGKSTLLSVVTSAKPKIANYEFTTLKPNLGIVSMTDYRTFVMADIPGIIEGASEGKGLGHYFLRHIERNSILLYVIPVDAKDLKKEFEILNNELKKYNPELIDKDFAIFFSKSDLMDKELLSELEAIIKKDFKKIPYFIGSSINMNGIKSLKEGLWKILN